MSRADRKRAYAEKKQVLLQEVAEMMAKLVTEGKSTREAFGETDRWLVQKVKENPQEGQMYREVALEYVKLAAATHVKNEAKLKAEVAAK